MGAKLPYPAPPRESRPKVLPPPPPPKFRSASDFIEFRPGSLIRRSRVYQVTKSDAYVRIHYADEANSCWHDIKPIEGQTVDELYQTIKSRVMEC